MIKKSQFVLVNRINIRCEQLKGCSFIIHVIIIIFFTPFHFHTKAFSMGTTEESLRKPLTEELYTIEIEGKNVSSLKASYDPKPNIDAAIQDLNAFKLDKSSIE